MAVPYYNYIIEMYGEREARKMQRRQVRDICDPFELPNNEFQRVFRINKEMGHYLVEQLGDELQPHGVDGIPAHIKILCSVEFLANGGYQRQLGLNHTNCCAQTTVSKFIDQFVDVVYTKLFNEWVNFPNSEQKRRHVAEGFAEKFGVPNVLGAIDCTHVKIFPPKKPEGIAYKTLRKGDYTLNVQLIADSDCRIINVNARFPGRVHDSFIWQASLVRDEMQRLHSNRIGSYFLLGDSGYPLEPWLMTPIIDAPPNSAEQRYANWHCQSRNVIERTNGYLKGSLRCIGIDRVLHYEPEKSVKLIYASCILYNIMKHFGVELGEVNEEDTEEAHPVDNNDQPPNLLRTARSRRQEIVDAFFN